MASALHTPVSKFDALAAVAAGTAPWISQFAALAAVAPPLSQQGRTSLLVVLAAVAPPKSAETHTSQAAVLIAEAGGLNVSARASQAAMLIAYATGVPGAPRTDSWTYVLDGHRQWVLPLGLEGDWVYDTTTKQWSQFDTQGFPGLNFTHGVMWGLRVMGGDALYPLLYELDPTQANDEGWRPVEHVVTGGVQTRSPNMIGVANFRLTASVGKQFDTPVDINLTFSDDNGNTWCDPFVITVAQGDSTQNLLWPALGSFSAPGRIFQISDAGGFLSISGADAALNNFDDDAGDKGNGG